MQSDCPTCGHSLVFDMLDDEEMIWCPSCGKAYEDLETDSETGMS